MNINFNGYGENVVTFAAESGVTAGCAVKMSSNNTVSACSDNDKIAGIAVNVRNGFASVKTSGFVQMSTSDNTITVGYNKLVSDGTTVEKNDSGKEYLVISVDADTVGFIL